MNVLTSGIPLDGLNILRDALDSIYGVNAIEIIELNKSNLRQRVHLGCKDEVIETVLIVLDKASYECCKNMSGLAESDKLIVYETNKILVNDLNMKYEIELVWEESEETYLDVSSNLSNGDDRIDKLETLLSEKDLIISNLSSQIKELEAIINYCDLDTNTINEYESIIEEINKELLDTKARLLDVTSSNSLKVEALEKEREELFKNIEDLKTLKNDVLNDLNSVSVELKNYKVKYSTNVGLLTSKENEIVSLKEEILQLNNEINSSKGQENEVTTLKQINADLQHKVSELNDIVNTKQKEVDRLELEISEKGIKSSKEVDCLNKEIKDLTSENTQLKGNIIDKDTEISKLTSELSKLNTLEQSLGSLKDKNLFLNKQINQKEDTILKLNQDKIELESKLDILERSTSRDTDIESVISEINMLRKKYAEVTSSVFNRIAEVSMPTNSLSSISVVKNSIKYENIHFVFSGSAESRKGMYKCLRDNLKSSSKNILIVDVVSETNIDYVFQMGKVVNGMNWFVTGGGVSSYISSTNFKNIFVLSPGLTFINDSYFLSIDWDKRLKELSESGYEVYLVCGDISNMVGRILHESFSSCGDVTIYVHGNANGCRTLITNIKGLSKAKESNILYYEFNSQVEKLYNIVSKNYNCSIISNL